jgi:translation initiation factor IF-3
VRVIDAEGQQVGIVSLAEALRLAQEVLLDLVEIVPDAKPPVCKIMDFGKHLYQIKKNKSLSKRHQKQIHLKQITMRSVIDDSGYQLKQMQIMRHLENGDKVRVNIRYRGRELSHEEVGRDVVNRLLKDLEAFITIEQAPIMEGKQLSVTIAPKKTMVTKKQ